MAKHKDDLHYYPDGGLDLREELARRFSLRVANVIAGSGSEGIMSNIIRAFLCDDDEVLTSEGTFVGFYVLTRSRGVKMITVPLNDYRFDLPAIGKAITDHTKIIYLANPNNPTGTIFTVEEFDAFMKMVPPHVLIILDEAYFEYAKDNPRYPDSMHYRYDNVITLRTFSKVYGLAGVRIGYGFAHDELIGNLLKVKLPFEPSTLAQAAGLGARGDHKFLERSLAVNRSGKEWLIPALRDLGLTVVPTEANFVLVPLGSARTVDSLYDGLLHEGVIIRPLKAFGLPACVRITIGTREQNDILIDALRKVLPAVPQV
jgi:histidinol-phosphate aminotransferase